MSISKTVVISCAGVGSRLGLGKTKALIEICGKPIIAWHLDMLKKVDDVRVVVGYQADQVIDTVLSLRRDVTFVFNHDYHATGTAHSFYLGARYANEWVISLDGDLLVDPADFQKFLALDHECLGYCIPNTQEPVLVSLDDKKRVVQFSRTAGQYEWTGLMQVSSRHIAAVTEPHLYQALEKRLPLPGMLIDAREIDTPADYDAAVVWMNERMMEIA